VDDHLKVIRMLRVEVTGEFGMGAPVHAKEVSGRGNEHCPGAVASFRGGFRMAWGGLREGSAFALLTSARGRSLTAPVMGGCLQRGSTFQCRVERLYAPDFGKSSYVPGHRALCGPDGPF
jgi:hypothetical protein